MVNISAVVGNEEPAYEGQPSCESDDGVADFGVRYMDLATRTDGAVESICDDDFSPIASELGLTVSGLEVEFILSGLPDESSMKVKIYGDAEETSLIGELEKDDYSYVVARNAVRFELDQIPPSESYVLVEYRVLAEGSQIASDTGEVTP